MKAVAKLKDEARKHEQKEEWDKAIECYVQVLEAGEGGEGGEVDLALYNRVGDLYVRLSKPNDAVTFYERAADHYAEAGLYNNAIALCNKVLRYVPGRVEVLKKLGQYSAAQGFITDARRWYLDYAEKQLKAGRLDDAFSALEDFANVHEDADVRELLGRQYRAYARDEQAVGALTRAYQLRIQANEIEAAEKVKEEILALDPSAVLDAPSAAAAAPAHEEQWSPGGHGEIELPGLADLGIESAAGAAFGAPDAAAPEELGAIEIEGLDLPPIGAPPAEEPAGAVDMGALDGGMINLDAPALGQMSDEPELQDISLDSDLGAGAGADLAGDLGDDLGDDLGGALSLPTLDEPADTELPGLDLPGLDDSAGTDLPMLDTGFDDLPGIETEPAADAGFDLPLETYHEEEEPAAEAGFDLPLETYHEEAGGAEEAGGVEEPGEALVAELPAFDEPEPPAPEPPAPEPPAPEPPPPAPAAAAPVAPPRRPPAPPARNKDEYIDLGALIAEDDEPEDTRFVVAETAPTGDEDRDFAEMLSQFKQKVSEHLSIDDAAAHYDLGLAFKEMGLIDEAIGEFQTAMKGGEARLKVYEELGTCFVLKEQWNVAVTVLNRALQIPVDNEEDMIGVWYSLGRAFEGQGNREQAKGAYERVISLDIGFQDAMQRLSSL